MSSALIGSIVEVYYLCGSPRHTKGIQGHVALVGGDKSMCGAILMASRACARAGAGLLRVCTRKEHAGVIVSNLPEAMTLPIEVSTEFHPELTHANILVVGPGVGRSEWSKFCLKESKKTAKPMVLDADALNLIAELGDSYSCAEEVIMTPHPGEAARLLGVHVTEVQKDRFWAVSALYDKYQCVVVLKGAGTLICADKKIWLANVGNPGMASAGMGDILAGIIGSLWAQGLTALEAAKLGVVLHGEAGDYVAKTQGQRGMLATDLIDAMRKIINER